jgi:hypothetical protein
MEYIERIEKNGMKAQGKTELLNYLNGKPLSARAAIKAHCYDCMGFYADGRNDCELIKCSLYPFMPYSSKPVAKRKQTEKQKENSKKAGFLLKGKKK